MKRLPMRKIRDVLRLSAEGLSTRQMAASLAIGRTTLRGYLDRADELGLSWPLPPGLSDTDLERQIYPRTARDVSNRATQPDWAQIHRELRRKGVTLSLLWEEYRADHPEGYGYSRFCELYNQWEGKLSPVMRQRHPAGERLFVDYAGHTVDVIDPTTGEVRTAQMSHPPPMWSQKVFRGRMLMMCPKTLFSLRSIRPESTFVPLRSRYRKWTAVRQGTCI
jgi:hypothetical protein